MNHYLAPSHRMRERTSRRTGPFAVGSWLLLAAMVLAGCTQPQPQESNFVPVEVLADGYEGEWILVNYWATWCGPCIGEIPELNRLHAEHPGVVVLGVNFDDPQGEQAQSDRQKMKIEFPVLLSDPSHLLNVDRPMVLPTTYIVSPAREVVEILIGPQTEETLLTRIAVARDA
jgi:thiol-disulfide isomerase/thioredoxin